MNARDLARCSVYFIQNVRTGHVKIIAYIEDGIAADIAHERAARAGQAA